MIDRSEKVDGAEEAIFKSTSIQGYLSSKLRKTKCSKLFEDNHTGSGINTFSAIIIIVQKIAKKHDTTVCFNFALHNRLPPRPTKIRKKTGARPIRDVSTEQKLANGF